MGRDEPYDTGAATHVGLVRARNEDRYLVRSDIGLWAVADGMGGHEAGDAASAALVETLDAIKQPDSPAALLRACEDCLVEANGRIRALARARGAAVMGTTVVALLIFKGHYACVWAGDSRAYLSRRGKIHQLTRDHNEARELLEKGVLKEDEASAWPRRNVITRAIGAFEKLETETIHGELAPGDVFVLCSDGLTGHVNAEEIRSHLAQDEAQTAADALIALALERGGDDNVTVVVVRCAAARSTTIVRAETFRGW